MPNFVLDQNASDINDALNRAHNPNTTPTNGITDKFVTSDGIYQALQDLDASNFNAAALIDSTETWDSADTKIATTAAIAAKITADITDKPTFEMSNLTGTESNTGNSYNMFQTDDDFGGSWTITDNMGSLMTNDGQGIFTFNQVGTYLVEYTLTGRDTSTQNHRIRAQYKFHDDGGFTYISMMGDPERNHTANNTSTHRGCGFAVIETGGSIKIYQDRTSGSGGAFLYKNATLKITKISG